MPPTCGTAPVAHHLEIRAPRCSRRRPARVRERVVERVVRVARRPRTWVIGRSNVSVTVFPLLVALSSVALRSLSSMKMLSTTFGLVATRCPSTQAKTYNSSRYSATASSVARTVSASSLCVAAMGERYSGCSPLIPGAVKFLTVFPSAASASDAQKSQRSVGWFGPLTLANTMCTNFSVLADSTWRSMLSLT